MRKKRSYRYVYDIFEDFVLKQVGAKTYFFPNEDLVDVSKTFSHKIINGEKVLFGTANNKNYIIVKRKIYTSGENRITKKQMLLDEIKARNGMRYSDCQRFVCKLNGYDFDEKDSDGKRKYRGFWCTNLTSILKKCKKVGNKYYL